MVKKHSVLKKHRSHVKHSVSPVKKVSEHKTREKEFMTEKDIAVDFATRVNRKFDRLVKASVLFGSQTDEKNTAVQGSDIDIVLIVDDASINWDLELVSWYREELSKLISAQNYSSELHINTIKLTTWWEDLIHGDPVVINILRYGEALIDSGGFFNPVKALLFKGKIKSTPEAVHAALQRAPWHITRSKTAEMSAIEGSYWAMVDSAQAALMTAGKIPPSPDHIPEMLKSTFVDHGMLKANYIKEMQELYYLHKGISHGQIKNIKGAQIDLWQESAEKFLIEMTRIIDNLLDGKK
ncbi:MAG: nucleotidyltransferase domain-containing protein [Nanoarchaeota archaeon]